MLSFTSLTFLFIFLPVSLVGFFLLNANELPKMLVFQGRYYNRVEISNYGSLPKEIDINNLLAPHKSYPNNPLIANCLYLCKMIESWGRGFGLIFDECQKSNIPAPKIVEEYGEITVIFSYKTTQETTQETAQETAQENKYRLTEQQSLIIEYLKQHPNATRRELATTISLSEDGIKYNLAKLQQLGILQRVGSTKSGYWQVISKIDK